MAEQVSSLIVRLIDEVTGPARAVGRALAGIGKAAGGVTGMDRLDAALARANKRVALYRGQMVDAIASFYAVGRAVRAPIDAARNFEAAYADVKKVVEFPTTGPYSADEFRKQLINLSKRVPLSAEELTKIAAAGGQAGVALSELAGFTENVAQVSTAFEISTEEAGTALANLKGALKLNNPQVMLLADHMNVLANNMATSERQVLDVVNRVGALGSVVGINAKDVAALGAAMTSAGSDAESAGTAIRNMFLNLAQGSGMTKEQLKAMDNLGIDSKNFPKRMQTEGIAAIVDLLERVAKLPKEKQASTLTDLFDKRAVDALGPMLNNLDLFRQALGLVADDQKNAGASQREFEKRTDTFDAKMKTFNNTLNALNITIGDALIPALTSVLEKITPIIEAVATWAAEHPKLTAAIVGSLAGFFALNAALIVLKYTTAVGWAGLLTLTKNLITLGGATSGLSTAGLIGIGAGIGAIAIALGTWAYVNWDELTAGWSAFMGEITISGADQASLGRTVEGIKELAGIDLSFLKMDQGSGAGYGASIGKWANEEIARTIADTEYYVGQLKLIKAQIVGLFDGTTFAAWGTTINAKIAEMQANLQSSIEGLAKTMNDKATEWEAAGRAMVQALWDGMVAIFDSVIAWVQQKANELLAPFTGLGAKIKGALGFGGGEAAPAASGPIMAPIHGSNDNSLKGQARGGPVTSKPYLVGERGPEIFKPATSGTIIPNKALGGGGGTTIAPTFNINIAGSADASTVENIRRVLRDEVRQAFRGVYADAGLRFA